MTAKFVAAYKAGKDDEARAPSIPSLERIRSASRLSLSHLVILILSSTSARPIWSPARSGLAGTGSRKISGRPAPRITSRSAKPSAWRTRTIS